MAGLIPHVDVDEGGPSAFTLFDIFGIFWSTFHSSKLKFDINITLYHNPYLKIQEPSHACTYRVKAASAAERIGRLYLRL